MRQVKVLLVQLAANGDCLFVTAIAKQIKDVDYPDCHLTWLIGSRCIQVIENNPFVDDIIQIPLSTVEDTQNQRNKIAEHIISVGGYTKFDKIFITDYTKTNYKNWYGTTRSSLFRSYPHRLKINPQPLIYLTDQEKRNVGHFCKKNKITFNTYNILFECAPQSGQSLMTFERARQIAEELAEKNSSIRFVLTSNRRFVSNNPNIIDGSVISWRENAELANYCNLIVGCSSGISWLCTANCTKTLPMIQVINSYYAEGAASMKIDFKFFDIDTSTLIELDNPDDSTIKKCIIAASINTFEVAKKQYDRKIDCAFLNFNFLKESHLPIHEKAWFLLRYFFRTPFIVNIYKAVKLAALHKNPAERIKN